MRSILKDYFPIELDDIMAMLFDQPLDDFSIDDLCGYNNSIIDQNFWDAEENKVREVRGECRDCKFSGSDLFATYY